MSPEAPHDHTHDDRFDDDRLLAYALALDPDPELREALQDDERLRERLQHISADLSAIETQVRMAVPPAGEGWSDLSSTRWHGLQPYVRVAQPSPTGRRRLSIRVLGPALAAAAAIALALGLTLSHGDFGGGPVNSQRVGGDATLGAPELSGAGGASEAARQAAAYTTIVVAKAQSAAAGTQRFAVLRVLKGSAPAAVTLTTSAGGALPEGSLAVLYLLPVEATPTSASSCSASPHGEPSKQFGDGTPAYAYRGSCAAVQPLPAGTRPQDVTLP